MDWNPLGDQAPISVTLPEPEDVTIVVVDDQAPVLKTIGRFLARAGYAPQTFESAQSALDWMSGRDVELLITDVVMPGMTGVKLAERALEGDPNLAILIMTGAATTDSAVDSLRLGVQDYLMKPIDMNGLLESVERTLRGRAQAIYRRRLESWLRDEVTRRTEQLERVTVSTLSALVRAMEAKDPYLKGHSERVAKLCEGIATRLSLPIDEVDAIRTAGLLHDIGMIAVREPILRKSGELTSEEYRQVRQHPEIGATILEPLAPTLGDAVDYVRFHHERLNGTGYPAGLRRDEIPLGAQIVGLSESYAAMTEERPFRPASSAGEALETLRGSEGMWYEGHVLRVLEEIVREEAAARKLARTA